MMMMMMMLKRKRETVSFRSLRTREVGRREGLREQQVAGKMDGWMIYLLRIYKCIHTHIYIER